MSDYKSKLEAKAARQLERAGIVPKYEDDVARIPYYPPPNKRRYTPDFWLPNGIIIEMKGHFKTGNRRKLKHVSRRYPDLDIRLVFSRAENTISKKSDTTYAMWCDRYGFPWADNGVIPKAWIEEPKDPDRIRAIKEIVWRWDNREYDPHADIPDDL